MTQSRIPFTLGITLAAISLGIGCFIARVAIFTCNRDINVQQRVCQLEESTLLLPWNKQIKNFQLDDIQKAESIEVGVDTYTVVLRFRNNSPESSLYKTEYSENSERLASQINSFLNSPKAEVLSIREGGGIPEIIVLLSFCVSGMLLACQGKIFGIIQIKK